jgi:5'-methylthioadenosine phosphorylase
MYHAEIGIIGGSGLYTMPGLTEVREVRDEQISTPFGDPSDWMVLGVLDGRKVAFLARHGRGHRILPSDLNFRANIYAMKQLGVTSIMSISAVGSLKEEHAPGTFVIPDQFIDRTFGRRATFFGDGVVAHVSMADPVCPETSKTLLAACNTAGVPATLGGTYVCMEGPQFSTRAESRLYRSWGADVVGMTNLQEAKLAREAEICYATLAMVTDYDCWHDGHADVTTEQVLAVMNKNGENAIKVVRAAIAALPAKRGCNCQSALRDAIITKHSVVPFATRQRLRLVLDKYLQ